jgi:hypothetical protein
VLVESASLAPLLRDRSALLAVEKPKGAKR